MSKISRERGHDERVTWVYWISRDSLGDDLSGVLHLWYRKPTRVKWGKRVTWVASDDTDPGCLGEHSLEHMEAWFRTIPETSLELVRVEMCPSAKDLAEAAAQGKR